MTAPGSACEEPVTLEQAFWKYKDLVWRFFACAGVPLSCREDLSQDTFYQVLKWWPEGIPVVRNWSHVLLHCAKLVLKNHRRKMVRHPPEDEYDSSHADQSQPSIEWIVGNRELLEISVSALERMDEDDRLLVQLKLVEGFSLDEIVAIMKSTRTVLKSRIQRARDEFRGLLLEETHKARGRRFGRYETGR